MHERLHFDPTVKRTLFARFSQILLSLNIFILCKQSYFNSRCTPHHISCKFIRLFQVLKLLCKLLTQSENHGTERSTTQRLVWAWVKAIDPKTTPSWAPRVQPKWIQNAHLNPGKSWWADKELHCAPDKAAGGLDTWLGWFTAQQPITYPRVGIGAILTQPVTSFTLIPITSFESLCSDKKLANHEFSPPIAKFFAKTQVTKVRNFLIKNIWTYFS